VSWTTQRLIGLSLEVSFGRRLIGRHFVGSRRLVRYGVAFELGPQQTRLRAATDGVGPRRRRVLVRPQRMHGPDSLHDSNPDSYPQDPDSQSGDARRGQAVETRDRVGIETEPSSPSTPRSNRDRVVETETETEPPRLRPRPNRRDRDWDRDRATERLRPRSNHRDPTLRPRPNVPSRPETTENEPTACDAAARSRVGAARTSTKRSGACRRPSRTAFPRPACSSAQQSTFLTRRPPIRYSASTWSADTLDDVQSSL